MIRTLALLLAFAAAAPAASWVSLFNGKDFTGWKVNENLPSFAIEDGAIVAKGPRSHCFYVGDIGNHQLPQLRTEGGCEDAPRRQRRHLHPDGLPGNAAGPAPASKSR